MGQEELCTIRPDAFEDFFARIPTAMHIKLTSSCVLFKTPECPDLNPGNPHCGSCTIAYADQIVFAGRMNPFEPTISSVPVQTYDDGKVLETWVQTMDGTARISHMAGNVEMEFLRST